MTLDHRTERMSVTRKKSRWCKPGLLGSGSGLLRRAAAPKIQNVPVKEFIHRPAVVAQKAQGFVKNDVGSGGATAAGCNFDNGTRAEDVESQDKEDTNEPRRPAGVPTRGLELRSRLGIFGRLFHEQSIAHPRSVK
jgi:hypothetical protein